MTFRKPTPGMLTSADVQRLRVHLVVHDALEQLPELRDVDVCRVERGLGKVGAGSCEIVAVRRDAGLGHRDIGRNRQDQGTKG